MSPISRGFSGRRRRDVDPARVPPGQYVTDDFPVLTYGPTPRIAREEWRLRLDGAGREAVEWGWDAFMALEQETFTVDVHCVTKWSKLDTTWTGVPLDALVGEPDAEYLLVSAAGDYTTNLPLEEVLDGRAWAVHSFGGEPLAAEHGGPVRLLVPGLYLWKSAKWLTGLTLSDEDEPGFWETNGYHNHGDPWREERYW